MSIIMLGGATFYIIGGLISNKFVKRFGRKATVTLASLPAGIFILLFLFYGYQLSLLYLGVFSVELCQQLSVV